MGWIQWAFIFTWWYRHNLSCNNNNYDDTTTTTTTTTNNNNNNNNREIGVKLDNEHRYNRIWHSEDRALWHSLIIKPTRCTNFSNLFLEQSSTCFGPFLCPSPWVYYSTHSNTYRFADSLRTGSERNYFRQVPLKGGSVHHKADISILRAQSVFWIHRSSGPTWAHVDSSANGTGIRTDVVV